jgi:hypothetical protein
MKNFVYHTSRNCFASIRTYNTRLSTRIANRTHARKRAVSGLVIQITITALLKLNNLSVKVLLVLTIVLKHDFDVALFSSDMTLLVWNKIYYESRELQGQ